MVNGNHLTQVCIRNVQPLQLTEICQRFPNITKLKILDTVLSDEDQVLIASNLTQLETVQIKIQQIEFQVIRFVDGLPKLKHLKLKSDGSYGPTGGYNWLNFYEPKHCNLEELNLENFSQSKFSFNSFDWFAKFPHLQCVTLTDCFVDGWFNVVNQLSKLGMLRYLEMNNVSSRTEEVNVVTKRFFNLEVLKIKRCDIPIDILSTFLRQSSQILNSIYLLENVILNNNPNLTLAVLQNRIQYGDFLLNETQVSSLEDISVALNKPEGSMQNY